MNELFEYLVNLERSAYSEYLALQNSGATRKSVERALLKWNILCEMEIDIACNYDLEKK